VVFDRLADFSPPADRAAGTAAVRAGNRALCASFWSNTIRSEPLQLVSTFFDFWREQGWLGLRCRGVLLMLGRGALGARPAMQTWTG